MTTQHTSSGVSPSTEKYESIPRDDFDKFCRRYWKGGYPHLRFGQAFCAVFVITDPDLFYQTSVADATTMMYKYVKWR